MFYILQLQTVASIEPAISEDHAFKILCPSPLTGLLYIFRVLMFEVLI